jgi:hypothetical protein
MPGHDEHRGRERRKNHQDPRKVVERRCDLDLARPRDRVGERRANCDGHEEDDAESCARGSHRRRPAAFTRITQIGGERRCETEQVQDCKAEDDGGNQNSGAIAVIEGDELVG